jgi:small ligand-binding sensory domain FIST
MSNFPPPAACSLLLLDAFDEDRVEQRLVDLRGGLGGPADLVLAFLSVEWLPHLDSFLELVQIRLQCRAVAGCSAGGLIAGGSEHEAVPGCSLLALSLGGGRPRFEAWGGNPAEWPEAPGASTGAILLGHPLELPVDLWMAHWQAAYPGVPAFGGLASGGSEPGELALFTQDGLLDAAVLAVHFAAPVRLCGLVGGACRPLGLPQVITGADGNIVTSLGGEKPLLRLERAFADLQRSEGLPRVVSPGIFHAGLPMPDAGLPGLPGGPVPQMVRPILGADPDSGAVAVAAMPRVGQTLQFHIRDPDTADRDWREACRAMPRMAGGRLLAGLLFSCLGRGSAFFGFPDHDAAVFEEEAGPLPVAGAFVSGELGVVHDLMLAHTLSVSGACLVCDT